MTEAEWLVCTDPKQMLVHLGTTADKRRCMLFACACERRLWNEADCERAKVEATERYADGQATAADVLATLQDIGIDDVDEAFVTSSVGKWRWAISESRDSAAFVADITLRDLALKEGRELKNLEAELARKTAYEAEIGVQSFLLRDIFGNPFRPLTVDPAWLSSAAIRMAEATYAERAFDRLPILADALEESGWTSDDILSHCRRPGIHVRGCWVLDLILTKK
jgi:hypothetical protein